MAFTRSDKFATWEMLGLWVEEGGLPLILTDVHSLEGL